MKGAKKKWSVLGMMSGTSLDGLDLAVCTFYLTGSQWHYEVKAAKTIPYSKAMQNSLSSLATASAERLAYMDANFGKYSGEQAALFLKATSKKVDLIASHGHTIFHQPENKFTFQLGNGAYIAAYSGIPTVSDFRSMDVALGGQGAPLVPIGDKLLFSDYTYCLNLGGIANISFDKQRKRYAGDCCPVNLVLNALAQEKGKAYDKNGAMAAQGKVSSGLLEKLNALDFYTQPFPKSLGREWVERKVVPLLHKSTSSTEDKLATFCEHIAIQLSACVSKRKKGTLLITGGGAFNKHLINRIKFHMGNQLLVVEPDAITVGFKEAIIFAFLGVQRLNENENCLKEVTGASSSSIGGAIYLPLKVRY